MPKRLSPYNSKKVGFKHHQINAYHDRALIAAEKTRYDYQLDPYIDSNNAYRSLFIYNLSHQTEDEIEKHYSQYGHILSVIIAKDIVTRCPKPYGFIVYKHRSDMQYAFKYGHNISIGNCRPIKCDYVRVGEQDNFKPRRLGGGYGGRIHSSQFRFGGRET